MRRQPSRRLTGLRLFGDRQVQGLDLLVELLQHLQQRIPPLLAPRLQGQAAQQLQSSLAPQLALLLQGFLGLNKEERAQLWHAPQTSQFSPTLARIALR